MNRENRLKIAAVCGSTELLAQLNTSLTGLDQNQVAENRRCYGNNQMSTGRKKSLGRRLGQAFVNPFTAILTGLAGISLITDPSAVAIIVVMVMVSGILRFVQETRSENAATKLLNLLSAMCVAEREGQGIVALPVEELVAGDIIHLAAGDIVPADARIIEATELLLSQSALTGESLPVEKNATQLDQEYDTVAEYPNLVLAGSNVVSGSARAVIVAVGDDTVFGSVARSISGEKPESSFTKGINSVSWVLIRFMAAMVPVVFLLSGITKGNWMGALLFSVSVAVGLTPEMLPVIVTTCLAKGAVSMSRKKTIVKNLNAMQDFGAMDVLCTDKTGTLTRDEMTLEHCVNPRGKEDEAVLAAASLNSRFQTGYRNPLDLAILRSMEGREPVGFEKTGEIPFDFQRRRLSVAVCGEDGVSRLITKGAVEEMLSICTWVQGESGMAPMDQNEEKRLLAMVNRWNSRGFRVLALASKELSAEMKSDVTASDLEWNGMSQLTAEQASMEKLTAANEQDMILTGFLAFLDPPKKSAAEAVRALSEHGVITKVLTGDNDKVTERVCSQVGISTAHMLLGRDLDKMTDQELALAVENVMVFAKLSPDQKARVVGALRENGHTVGFLGDGINDAPAMKRADIGISVDSAVDIARESADIILLEKDLMVLEKGVLEGRKIYGNMIRYIKMTASSNFGNVLSVLAASAFLPFLPMASVQLILLNLIYDLSCTAIPWDNVDEEYLKVPRKWDASSVGKFMLRIGPVSSVFDWLTFAVLYFVICPHFVSGGMMFHAIPQDAVITSGMFAGMHMKAAFIALFQAGWFVESMWSQTMVIHMLRTPKIPFLQSRASAPLTMLTCTGAILLTIIPFTPMGTMMGFVALPSVFFLFLAAVVCMYMWLTTVCKKRYIRRYGELL